MEKHVDTLLLGGGPAAASAAITLGRAGHCIALLYRTAKFVRQGEVLSANALPLLQKIDPGLANTKGLIRAVPGAISAWGRDSLVTRPSILNPYGDDILLDRSCFDASLRHQAASLPSVEVISLSAPFQVEDVASGWRVRVDDQHSYVARYILDGTGRIAYMARRFGKRMILDRMICFYWELISDYDCDRDDRLLVTSDEAGWWYSIRTAGDTRILCRFAESAHPHVLRLDQAPFPASPLLADIMHIGRYCIRRSFVFNASIEVTADSAPCRWMAVGDAYATVDPLSGQGCLRAITDGHEAAHAIEALFSGSDSDASALIEERRRSVLTDITRRREIYARERRWRNQSFWANRAS